jgi:hypothetical protein
VEIERSLFLQTRLELRPSWSAVRFTEYLIEKKMAFGTGTSYIFEALYSDFLAPRSCSNGMIMIPFNILFAQATKYRATRRV